MVRDRPPYLQLCERMCLRLVRGVGGRIEECMGKVAEGSMRISSLPK